ncbi:hypothetical protein P175DRAFT_0535652 [Aspergillus ochraceoroseus IBT 24754]|uniref:Uncharacterized protein n=1 Tax=Aspergillus ochraceoroseus IBT 24754 TaxID=1392256 RepID=A0A2T5LNP5_9EURO|nr:uncharacterized protein P175DRAFT_0535652 [Aspergillus ochraceoroseus IBT 24754]PTU17910.1 hypothetical protein P175DRAFT_0535652 [Aspergillus ochraceoroseus IBT 24754]
MREWLALQIILRGVVEQACANCGRITSDQSSARRYSEQRLRRSPQYPYVAPCGPRLHLRICLWDDALHSSTAANKTPGISFQVASTVCDSRPPNHQSQNSLSTRSSTAMICIKLDKTTEVLPAERLLTHGPVIPKPKTVKAYIKRVCWSKVAFGEGSLDVIQLNSVVELTKAPPCSLLRPGGETGSYHDTRGMQAE